MFNKHARVHVIKHIQSSTMYGINNDCVVCFHEKSHAKQVRKSLIKYKQTYKRNPDQNKLCVYTSDQIESCIDDIKAIEYGLLILDVNLENLLINLSQRHIGIYVISDIQENEESMNIRYMVLNPYEYRYEEYQKEILEQDYLI